MINLDLVYQAAVTATTLGAIVAAVHRYLRMRFDKPVRAWVVKMTAAADRVPHMERLLSTVHHRVTLQAAMSRAIADAQDYGIIHMSECGDVLWANRFMATLTGWHESEFLGRGWVNTIAPEDRQRIVDEWQSAVEDGRDDPNWSFRYRTPNGKLIPVVGRSTVQRAEDGTVIGFLATIFPVGSETTGHANPRQ